MADFVYNVALGRVVELINRVNNNDPANSALVVVPLIAGGVSDATLKDLDTLDAILATAANEATSGGWDRIVLTDSSGITVTVTDANDEVEIDVSDQTFVTPTVDVVTDLVLCYDADTTSGDDTNIVPLLNLDFAATPGGGNIVWVLDASGFYRAT